MKKSVLAFCMSGILCVMLSGCGETVEAPKDLEAASQTEDASATTLPDAYMNYGDTGEGEAYIQSTNNNSEHGDVVQLHTSAGFKAADLSVITRDIAEKTPLYIYIDGKEAAKLDDPDTDTTLHLENDAVSNGTHTVTFVQYDNGDSTGTIVFYRTSMYNVG